MFLHLTAPQPNVSIPYLLALIHIITHCGLTFVLRTLLTQLLLRSFLHAAFLSHGHFSGLIFLGLSPALETVVLVSVLGILDLQTARTSPCIPGSPLSSLTLYVSIPWRSVSPESHPWPTPLRYACRSVQLSSEQLTPNLLPTLNLLFFLYPVW